MVKIYLFYTNSMLILNLYNVYIEHIVKTKTVGKCFYVYYGHVFNWVFLKKEKTLLMRLTPFYHSFLDIQHACTLSNFSHITDKEGERKTDILTVYWLLTKI